MKSVESFGYSRLFERPVDLHLAFHRPIAADLEFALTDFERRAGRPAKSVLELQCGPAYYAAEAARRGLRAVAVDTRHDMLDFARTLHADTPFETRVRHPLDLGESEPFDLVLLPLDSVTYLRDDTQLQLFLQASERCLGPKGLLMIEANHPKDVGYIDYAEFYGGVDARFPDLKVRAEWGINNPSYDLVTHDVATRIRITVTEAGQTTTREIDSMERQRVPREFALIAPSAGLKLEACFGGWKHEPLTWQHDLQLFVLRRNS